MKFPTILTVMAAVLGSTASFAATPPKVALVAPMLVAAPETSNSVTDHSRVDAGWLRLISGHDDDDEDDDDDCEGDDDDGCRNAKGKSAAPKDRGTPPRNGLFGTGKAPVINSN